MTLPDQRKFPLGVIKMHSNKESKLAPNSIRSERKFNDYQSLTKENKRMELIYILIREIDKDVLQSSFAII